MTYLKLGDGRYSVAQSTLVNGTPALTIHRLPVPQEVGIILDPVITSAMELDLIIEVQTAAAAGVLLAIAQAIAFAYGLPEKSMS